MKRKIYITGKVYNTKDNTLEEITADVQQRIDQSIGAGKVFFSIEENTPSTVIFNFKRIINNLGNIKPHQMSDADAALISGAVAGCSMPVRFPRMPFGYSYILNIEDFIYCYKKSVESLKASRFKKATFKSSNLQSSLTIEY